MTTTGHPAAIARRSTVAPVQAVVFTLGLETFALPVTTVREILEYRPAARVPEGPDWLLGLLDVRGAAVPMIDLHVRLGFPAVAPDVSTCILVTEVMDAGGRSATLGLVVDRVMDVVSFAAEDIGKPPEIGTGWQVDYVAGVIRRDDGFVLLLDLARLSFLEATSPPSAASPP